MGRIESAEILNKMSAVIEESLGVKAKSLSLESTALDIDGWDSLSHLSIMLQVEKAFNITIPIENTYQMRTLGELVTLIQKLLEEK